MRRPNPVFEPEYRALLGVLVQARRAAGISQRALASSIGKSHSHVCMIERGQRRVDSLEFYRLAVALGVDPAHLFADVVRQIEGARVEQR